MRLQDPSAIRRRLLAWYSRHRRDLPWRRTRDPYRIWLSEMMLQQTQVATVIPYYHRFLTRFPNVKALAAAPLDEVLRLWAGLGYYARARNLHRAARQIVEESNGRFPNTVEALMNLPGIGRYSAGAIASIAFDCRAPAVDGNVRRVLARLFHVDGRRRGAKPDGGLGDKRIWHVADELVPRRRCGDFNQALMELGATICLPGPAARCAVCPLRKQCTALAMDLVAQVPNRRPIARMRHLRHVIAAIERKGRFLVVQRPVKGLWGGLWELPSEVLDGQTSLSAAKQISRRWIGKEISVAERPFCLFTHRLTHRSVQFVGHFCRADPPRPLSNVRHVAASTCNHKWVRLDEIERLGISRAMKDVVAELGRTLQKTDY